MAGNVMTISADLGHSTVKEFVVVASVRNVTIQAILVHRRVRPHPGSPFIRMALIAEFVDRIRLELGGAEAAVVLMAIGALYFSFPNRMMGSPALLSPNVLVTEIAEVGLGSFQVLACP